MRIKDGRSIRQWNADKCGGRALITNPILDNPVLTVKALDAVSRHSWFSMAKVRLNKWQYLPSSYIFPKSGMHANTLTCESHSSKPLSIPRNARRYVNFQMRSWPRGKLYFLPRFQDYNLSIPAPTASICAPIGSKCSVNCSTNCFFGPLMQFIR